MPAAPVIRWIALAAILGNVAYSYLYPRLGLPTMREVSDRYENLFTPAPFAFAIWGVIYAAFIAFAVVALLPSRRRDPWFDRLAGPLAIVNVLAAAWVTMFALDLVWPCVAVIAATLAAAIVLYVRAADATGRGRSAWLRVPFSLLLGWISVATIANIAAALTASGFVGGDAGPVPWAIAMISIAAALGVFVGLRYRDMIVPAVVSWAAYAIYVHDDYVNRSVATAALIAAIACMAVAVVIAVGAAVAHQGPLAQHHRHHGA